MNTNRSFLDTLNTGRKRRSGTSLEHISRTLQEIENQLDRAYEATGARSGPRPQGRSDYRPAPPRGERARPASSLRDLASELERSRRQENEFTSIGAIAREVRTLRTELADAMQTGFRQEFATLRDDLRRIQTSSEAMRAERDPGIEALAGRLEQISDAVARLPETLPLRSLDDNIHALAGALDQFIEHSSRARPDLHGLIEERLDEISRAIAAAARAPAYDAEPFERIEARIASLARQVEEVVEESGNAGIADGLALLVRKVDDIAGRIDAPHYAVDGLTGHVAAIAERLDEVARSTDPNALYDEIDRRFAGLSELIDRRQSDAAEEGRQFFDDLKHQLAEVAVRLDRYQPGPGGESEMLAALDARFAELAARLDARSLHAAHAQAFAAIEGRLETLGDRLQESFSLIADMDPQIIRGLQEQIAGLARHIAEPAAGLPDFEDLGPRLARIERAIAENRESVVEAARQATEQAFGSLAGGQLAQQGAGALSSELKALETLTRRSDDRNARTFEAIHDTLLKIVDRLATMEGGSERASVKMAIGSPPSIEPDGEPGLFDTEAEESLRSHQAPAHGDPRRRTPAEAAAEAAEAALSDEHGEEGPAVSGRRSMLGGLTRAFSGRRERQAPAMARREPAVDEEAAIDADGAPMLDAEHMNEPLEPGSGAPDLNAIMRRVRDEGGQRPRSEDDAAKSDFIAAARRAAQAAAAEAETLKRKKGGEARGSGGRFSVGGLLRSRRSKALLTVAAVAVLATGVAISRFAPSGGGNRPDPVAATAPQSAPHLVAKAHVEAPADTAGAVKDTPARVVQPAEPATDVAGAVETGDTASADDAGEPIATEMTVDGVAGEPGDEASTPPQEMAAHEDGPAVEPAADTETTASTDAPAANAAGERPEMASLGDIPASAGPDALRQAAASGDPRAMFEIADRYAEGRGVESDAATAARWYEKAAEAGLAPAQYRIGNSYEKGVGVERDIGKAKTWYRLAADQGNASAMHNLGVLYAMGADGAADNDAAARWFSDAAELGVKDSQFNLGILSARGVGVQKDLGEAYKWFALVAATGDSDAAAKRDEIAATLDADALKQARAKADLWKAKPLDHDANVVEIPEAWSDGKATTAAIGADDMKKAVANIQLILNKNGYGAGPADGIMGEQTKSAIIAFQKDNGMAATGAVDRKLVQALLEHK